MDYITELQALRATLEAGILTQSVYMDKVLMLKVKYNTQGTCKSLHTTRVHSNDWYRPWNC